MKLLFAGVLWYWRGPAPFHFVTVPPEDCEVIRQVAPYVTYGWGMIPVTARIGETVWTTSLWPKDGTYILPVKAAVRRATGIALDDVVRAELTIGRDGHDSGEEGLLGRRTQGDAGPGQGT